MTTIYIQGIPFPDTATAAAYHAETFDIDEYSECFSGLSELISYLRFRHQGMSDTDINTLAAAVHAHATREDQDLPLRDSLRRLVKGVPIYVDERPAWEHPTDSLATLPPTMRHPTSAPTSIITRLARKLATR